jgi:hypothetical protein
MVVSKIVVPKEERGKGTGGQIMKRLTDAADRNGDTMALTPSKDFGASSVSRLNTFYKGHGFVDNKGKNKDFGTKESMIREPKKGPAGGGGVNALQSSTKAPSTGSGPADMRTTDAQVVRDRKATAAAAKPDDNTFTQAGKDYKQALKDRNDSRYRLSTGSSADADADRKTLTSSEAAMKKLWPQLTSRDVAEQAVRMDPSVNPEIRQSMVDEVTKHVQFTGKHDLWKRATINLGKTPPKVNGTTMHGEHIVVGDHLVGRDSFGKANVKKNDFKTGHHAVGTLGSDDVGGHKATLAHEIGHVVHHQVYGGSGRTTPAVPGTRGTHNSSYGNTNHHEGAAEAYAAAFARAQGHQYRNDQLADVGDQMAKKAREDK